MEFKKNQIVELYIDDMGTKEKGIGHIDGYALFLKDAVIGDKVRAKIIKTKEKLWFRKSRRSHRSIQRQSSATLFQSKTVRRMYITAFSL